jgi:hypothetical protein
MSDKDEFVLTVGQAQEIEFALRRNGFDAALVKVMTMGNNLSLFRKVLLCQAVVKDVKHSIDCDADPFLPQGWEIEEHVRGGHFQWNASKVELWLAGGQKNGKVLEGNKLRKELAKKVNFNANVLDYLLAHPHLIPEEWKGKAVFFWGTVYRSSGGYLYVRCLYWDGGRWDWSDRWLDDGWDDHGPAALRAS